MSDSHYKIDNFVEKTTLMTFKINLFCNAIITKKLYSVTSILASANSW